jgi:hypothetical protein
MTEDMTNLNTDLKELYVTNKIVEFTETLDSTADSIVATLTKFNYDIVKKYFDSEQYNIIFQHIKFVAFTSMMCEYAAKRQVLDDNEVNDMNELFMNIYNLIKQNQE